MPASKKHATQDKAGHVPPAQQPAESSSNLPSSSGDSPKRVTPKDITPEYASWADLKVTDVGAGRVRRNEAAAAADRGVGGSDTEADAGSGNLPSSQGDSPQEVTPKDITPEHASWNDVIARQVAPGGTHYSEAAERQESLIDEAVEQSFPASDPPAELPQSARCPEGMDCESEEEAQLDDAIELTFPASDPIAVSQITKVTVDRQ
jgi:hypothetical protein